MEIALLACILARETLSELGVTIINLKALL